MTRIPILFTTILCFFINKESITWSENYKLSWGDFKCAPDMNSNAAAITASGLTFGYNVKKENDKVKSFKVEVEARFYPEKSWVKPEEEDNHILAHEQLHFDITELFSRKLRKVISEVSISQNINDKLDGIHAKIVVELNAFQNQYDIETDFSRNFVAQAKWQEFINNELDVLKEYQ
jgi:hypothetical protein